MSKKIIFNDNEVVTNEDVEQTIDWRARDLNRVLEAQLRGTFSSDPGAGMVSGGAIVSGLEMTWNNSNLVVSISPGSGLFALGGSDPLVDNSFQLGYSESPVELSLPVADVTRYRWDLIEVSMSQVVTQDTRQVLSTGPLRTLSPTPVDKIRESSLRFRVRSGTPGVSSEALLPSLQPDDAWLPLFAVRVDPLRFRLLGIGGETNAQSFDLRKLLRRSRPDPESGHGFQHSVSMSSSGAFVASHRNWVQMGNYNGPLAPSFYIDITSGSSGPTAFPAVPLASPAEGALGMTLAVDVWYYVYAYRPHENSGYTAMFISNASPNTGLIAPTGRLAATPVLPAPFPTEITAPTQFMGSVRLAQSGGGFFPRSFRQVGGYVAMGTVSVSGFAGAVTPSLLTTTSLPVGTTLVNLNDVAGVLTVPPHCRMARVSVSLDNTSGVDSASLTLYNSEGYSMFATSMGPSDTREVTVDIPLGSVTKEFSFEVAGAPLSSRLYVLGYYEETP